MDHNKASRTQECNRVKSDLFSFGEAHSHLAIGDDLRFYHKVADVFCQPDGNGFYYYLDPVEAAKWR